MDTDAFLRRLVSQRYYQDQVVHIEDVPAREADYADVPGGGYVRPSRLRGKLIRNEGSRKDSRWVLVSGPEAAGTRQFLVRNKTVDKL